MADRIKNYEINYNITSNASQAVESFAALLKIVEQLSGKDPSTGLARGLTKMNGEINQLANSVNRLKTAFSEIRPEIDMSGFKSQIGQMQRAVSEFAQQTRNIMRMSLSGSDKQFAKARSAMAGNIFDAASLRHFKEELKTLPQQISEAQKAAAHAKKLYEEVANTTAVYPVGSTKEDQKNIAAAHKSMKQGLKMDWQEKEKIYKDLQTRQENYQRQIENLSGTLSQEEIKPIPVPKTATIPKGLQKATDLIPRWEKEYAEARQKAMAKRSELAKVITQPTKVEQPSWWKSNSLLSYMQQYDKAAKAGKTSTMKDARSFFEHFYPSKVNFDEEYKKYQAYQKYSEDFKKWMMSGASKAKPYNQTDEYQNYRKSLKRLRAAYSAQRQLNALKNKAAAQAAAQAAVPTGSNGPLPPILGIPTQVIEQAFTGKLTLIPDIAAARAAVAAERFNANLSLLPMISEVRSKLSAETFKVNVSPQLVGMKGGKGKGAATGAISTLQEEINALQNTAKAPITVGTKLERTGLLGRAQSGYQTLQTLANRHPITYKLVSDGSGGFSLNQALRQLAQLAKSHPVPFRMVHDGSGGFSLNQALTRLQALAAQRPIAISIKASAVNIESMIKSALAAKGTAVKSFPIDLKPRVGELTKSVKSALTGAAGKSRSFFVDVKARTGGLTSSISKALKSKTFSINAKLNTTNLDKVGLLERLQQVWTKLPRTGKRTYTVNLRTTGLENISRLERVIALVNSLPASRVKNYGANVVGGTPGGRSVQDTNPYGRSGRSGGLSGGRVYGGRGNDFYTRARSWAYPFTGNTSFGARTPAAFDMMKGMGMMMGIGGAMGVIGSSFSDAVGYQNTMETAKAILRDNYKGHNFNLDYNDMVRVVRDVAMRTKFTAPEAADAARFMAMAGLDIPMIKSAIAPIADVAAISDADLGEVADKMTNIMTEFKVSPSNMRNLADMMTKTFTSTNTDMMMLAESLQYAGPMAFASGQSLAETLAMIGIMGNSGIQASMAGTTMRMMLQNIYNPNKKQAAFMESIGLQTRDENGRRRSLYSILQDIARLTGSNDSKDVVGNLLSSKDEKNGIDTFDAASKLFRVTAAAGGASLLGNIDKVGDLIQQIQSADGNSRAVSLAKQNTVAGMWAQAKSAFTEAVVRVFEDSDMQRYLKNTLGSIINYMKQPEFIKTIKDLFELIKGIGSVLGTFVGWWVKLYQMFPGITKWVMIMQAFFTQIGYLMNPFIQLIGIVSSFGKSIAGVFGFGGVAAAGAAGTRAARMVGTGVAARGVASGSSVLGDALLFGAMTGTPRLRESIPYSAFASKRLRTLPEVYMARAERRYRGGILPGSYAARTGGGNYNIFRERSAILRRQAAIRQAQIDAFMTTTKVSEMDVYKLRQLQEMRRSKGRLLQKATEYSFLASNIAILRNQRLAERVKDSGLLVRAARQGRLGWGTLGRGIGTAFTTAFTANTLSQALGSTWSAVRGGLTNFALGAGKALGFLVNPATLAAGAIGGLAIAVGKSIYDFNKQNKEWQEGIKKSGVQFRDELQSVSGKGTSLKDIFDGIDTINVNGANVNINEGEINKMAPRISEDENLKDIYGALQGKVQERTDPLLGKHETIIKGVAEQTFKDAYDEYIDPMRKIMPGLPSSSQYNSYIESNGLTNRNEPMAAAAIVQAIIGQKGTQSSAFAKAENDIIKLAKDFGALSVTDQLAQYEEYKSKLMDIADFFNPTYHPNTIGITAGNYQQALKGSPGQYREYWESAYNQIISYIQDSPALKAIEAIYTLNSGVQEKTDEWWKAVVDLIGSKEFSDPKGEYDKIINFTIPTKDGQIDYATLSAKISATGTKLNDDISKYIEWVRYVYKLIFSNQELLDKINGLSNLSENDLINHLFGKRTQPSWMFTTPQNNNIVGIGAGSGTGAGAGANDKNGVNKYIWGVNGFGTRNGGTNPATKTPGYFNGNWIPGTSTGAPKPTAYNKSSLNNGYENTYAMNAQRPPQVIVNIEKLMDADMKIASSAEERQIAYAMENKIEQGLDILKNQIITSLQNGDYNIS